MCLVHSHWATDEMKLFNDLFDVIFSNGFPRLRIFTAAEFLTLRRNNAWTGCPSLRGLILDLRIPCNEEQIRSLCPNLCQYKCTVQPSMIAVFCGYTTE